MGGIFRGTRLRAVFVGAVVGFLAVGSMGCRIPVDSIPIDPGDGGGGGGGGGGPTPTPRLSVTPVPTPSASPGGPGPTAGCVTEDPNHQCIGLKWVSLINPSTGVATVNQADAATVVREINTIWSRCDIAFQMEDYEAVDPTSVGLDYGAASESQTNQLRRMFSDSSTFLVVVTGPWSGRTIAWTTEGGGGGPFGTIVELDYGRNPMTVGHELGHYMGLYHISDSSNLMNPYIGSKTSGLSSSQCEVAKQINLEEWKSMLRR